MDGAAPVAVKAAPSPKSPPKYPDLCGRRRLQLEVQILNREIGFLEEELQSLEGLQPVSRCCKEVEEFVGSKADPFLPIDKKRRRSCHLWKWLRSIFCFPASLLCCSCCQKSTCCSCCSPPKDCCCFNRKCHCPRCCLCKCPRLHCNHAVCPRCSSCPCFQSCCNITAPPCCDSCSCSCFHLPSCRIPRCCSCPCDCDFSCRLPDCCCCCPLEISCCRMPQCLACDLSFCMPWKWRCCCCFQEISCSLPRPSCPEYSCGCIWSCPKCTEARLCGSCCTSKSSCITGCLC